MPINRVTRADFQALAELRMNEALGLLSLKMYDGAYYLAGYAVECALKSCIAGKTLAEEFPPSPDITKGYYTHNLTALVGHAGLDRALQQDTASDAVLDGHWSVVKKWTEHSRYDRKTRDEADELINAVTDADHGVLPWIKARW